MANPGPRGLRLSFDTSEVVAYTKRLAKVEKATKPVIAAGVNEIGDSLVSIIATSLVQQTGLSLEQVRGLIRVDRASRNDPSYELRINEKLLQEGALRKLEGQRENIDFGARVPGTLVIVVSKKDELVCMDCEELEAAGPMPIEIANQHIPKHPNCRCIIMPFVPKGRRLPVTMTTVSGTDPKRRVGGKKVIVEADATIRQLAQRVLDKTTKTIRIDLS